ncbi:hypothetical protein HPP92_021878 [Vanilla planifolia]|uniref:FAD-binding domain-containing protein n=1 Tax=Vanilla planifolia TaxID=51239 RepID=A0A835PR78_VANPL|nr:hypothetical protein HPP92_021878 [Vanilla planifolia]
METWLLQQGNKKLGAGVVGLAESCRLRYFDVAQRLREPWMRSASGTSSVETTFALRGNFIYAAKVNMERETRCLKRNLLLQALVKDLPPGCIRYSSKIVSIEKGKFEALAFIDGSTIKTKVLVGCDGLNSVVANWLVFRQPTLSGRFACRGLIEDPQNPIMKRHIMEYFLGEGIRFGFSPCNDETLYWFFTWSPSNRGEIVAEEDPLKMRELLMDKLNNSTVPREVIATVEMSDRSCFVAAPLKFRWPFDLLRGNICKDNVCVAGDALHPMTPELGQGACSALEDAVVLARCLGEALLRRGVMEGGEQQFERVEEALREYARGRRWRSFSLVAASYAVGHMQQAAGFFMRFVKEILCELMAWVQFKVAAPDCGKL